MTFMMLPLWMWGIANAQVVASPPQVGVAVVSPQGGAGVYNYRVGERVQVTDEVLAILGVQPTLDRADEINFGVALEARIATNIDCGKLKLDVDINGDITGFVNELPNQVAGAGAALVSAAPMLFLCHASPSLCSELKNLNLRIDEDLDFRYAACKAVDSYIDKKAREGDEVYRDAFNDAIRRCNAEKVDLGMDVQSASIACQRETMDPRPSSIAQGFLGQVFEEGPQRIVRSALRAVGKSIAGKPMLQEFMLATMGDAEIGVNGEWTPIFAEGGSAGAEEVSQSLLYHGTRIACDVPKLRLLVPFDPEADVGPTVDRMGDDDWTDHTYEMIENTIKGEMVWGNTSDLQVLGWRSREVYCYELGEALALQAAKDLQSEWHGVAAKAMENPELPNYGKMKLKGLQAMLQDTIDILEKRKISTVTEALLIIQKEAAEMRRQAGVLANVVREGEENKQRMLSRQCDSFTSCGGVVP